MILSKEQILEELESGRLLIDPFDPSLVGAASVDLTVSRYFRRLSLHGGPIDVRQEADYRDYSEQIELPRGETILLMPGHTILGLTSERIRLSRGILGKSHDELELYRVKDSTLEQPFFLRLFGLGNIVLDTSDRSTPIFTFKAVPDPSALRDELRTHVEARRTAKQVREVDFE